MACERSGERPSVGGSTASLGCARRGASIGQSTNTGDRTSVKAKDPSITGSFDEPVRKGRKPEVSKQHPAVLKCRELYQTGMPLHRVSIEAGVEYTILARWYDKGWMDTPRKRKN